MRRISRQDCSLPGIGQARIRLWLDFGESKVPEQLSVRVVREAQVGGCEILINHWRTEKMSELLLFYRIAWSGQDVAPAGEHCASDFAVYRGEKRQVTFFKKELSIAAAQLDASRRFDFVGCGSIKLNAIQSCEEFAWLARRCLLRGERRRANERNQRNR